MPLFTPARRDTPEYLDDPGTDVGAIATSSDEIAQCNRLFGGTRALLAELRGVWPALGSSATLLDVGCGVGDLPMAARRAAASHGVQLRAYGIDRRAQLAARAATRMDGAAAADAFALPFADHSVDVVTACQVMHHFGDERIPAFARELTRVARRRVVVSDLRRSWIAAGGIWVASWPLRFHPITRHDGVVSILKGFEPREWRATLESATGRRVTVHSRPAFRVTASWEPAP